MADTVKTQVMKAIATALTAGVTDVESVLRREPWGADLETMKLPVLFFYEDEERREPGNRFDRGIIETEIAVFIRLSPKAKDPGFIAFYDLTDSIAGQIYATLRGNPSLSGTVLFVKENMRRKAIGNVVVVMVLLFGLAAP